MFGRSCRPALVMIDKKESYVTLQVNKRIRMIILIIFFFLLVMMGYIFRFYFWPFVFALVLYIALKPLNELLLRFVKIKLISSAIMILLLFLVILVPLFFLLYKLGEQSYQFYVFIKQFDPSVLMDFIHRSEFIKEIYALFSITEGDLIQKAVGILQKGSGLALSSITGVLGFSIKLGLNLFFMLLMLFFLFSEGKAFTSAIYDALPLPEGIKKDIVGRLLEVIRTLMAGNLLIMALQGIIVGSGMYIAGIGMGLLWGIIAAICSLIPVVGTAIVWLPPLVYLLATAHYGGAVFLGIWCLVLNTLAENVLKPLIFGDRLHFHPLIFFFLLLGSIQAFNLPGVIIGPILLTMFYSFWEIYRLLEEYWARGDAAPADAQSPATKRES